jgi:hypothetical protein
MTGALNALRQEAVELLQGQGIQAVAAWEPEPACRRSGTVAAVGLRGVKCADGGMSHYLGQRTGGEGGCREVLGRRVEVTLAVDLYAPRDDGASACAQTLEQVAEAVLLRGIAGLPVQSLEAGEVTFLEQQGLYRQTVQCLCQGWLTAEQDETGQFTDFAVTGRMK